MREIVQRIDPIFIILGTVLIYALVLAVSDIQRAVWYILSFPVHFFLLMLSLATCNYLIRFLKWYYYLGILEIRVPLRANLGIFFSGFSMTVTPGKSGELIKSFLLQTYGYPISRTAPVIVVERFTDLLGMCILAIIGAITLGIGIIPIVLVLGIILFPLLILQVERLAERCIDILGYLPILKDNREKLKSLHCSTKSLTSPGPLSVGLILSLISWFFECICLFVTVEGLGFHVSLFNAVFIFAFSSITGILAMLPGGLGATEGIMVLLLSREGVPLAAANASTLLARFATLWFAFFLGMAALFIMRRNQVGMEEI